MSSFLRESIAIKSTDEITLEIHINIFLSQKEYKKISFEMGIWVKKFCKKISQQTLQIIFPYTQKENNNDKSEAPKIEDLSHLFKDKNKNFTRLIFNEELKDINGTLKLNNKLISFQEITNVDFPSIKIQEIEEGNYYRFRIIDIEMDDLIIEQQCSSFIGDPIKRSIKTIGFYINNERNLRNLQNDDNKNRVENVLFECINTFVVCNMGVDILDSMQEKRSFRVLEDYEVWGAYLDGCVNKNEISKAVVYQFKKEGKLSDKDNQNKNEREEFKDFKLFLRFLETENNEWGAFLTGSTIITLAFITNTIFYCVTEKNITSGIMVASILLVVIVIFFYLKWEK